MHWYPILLLFISGAIFFNAVEAFSIVKRDSGCSIDLNQFRQQALAAHNDHRAKHCAPPLTLDDGLNRDAQAYAESLVAAGKLVHSAAALNGDVGENLHSKSSSNGIKSFGGSSPTDSWYGEVKDYDFDDAEFSSKTGHFTQVVWKETTKMGIGAACTKDGKKVYVAARYSPGGNDMDTFSENVKPATC